MAAPGGGTQVSPRAGRGTASSMYGVGQSGGGETNALTVVSHRAANQGRPSRQSACFQCRRPPPRPPGQPWRPARLETTRSADCLVGVHTGQPAATAPRRRLRLPGALPTGRILELLPRLVLARFTAAPPLDPDIAPPQRGRARLIHCASGGISAKRLGRRRRAEGQAGRAQIGEALLALTLARPRPRGLLHWDLEAWDRRLAPQSWGSTRRLLASRAPSPETQRWRPRAAAS